MDMVTKLSNILTEMDKLGEIINQRGVEAALKMGIVRDKISTILAVHRQLKGSAPPATSEPLTQLRNLERFRYQIKQTLRNKNVLVNQAHKIAEWNQNCKRLIARVNVQVSGFGFGGQFTGEKLVELKEIANELIRIGNGIIREKFVRCGHRKNWYTGRGVMKMMQELKESIKFAEKSLANKKPVVAVQLPAPITLQSDQNPFEGLPPNFNLTQRPVLQKNRLSLTLRRLSKK